MIERIDRKWKLYLLERMEFDDRREKVKVGKTTTERKRTGRPMESDGRDKVVSDGGYKAYIFGYCPA